MTRILWSRRQLMVAGLALGSQWAAAQDGVTRNSITIGQSLALTGAAASLALPSLRTRFGPDKVALAGGLVLATGLVVTSRAGSVASLCVAVALACLPVFVSGREIARWEGGVFLATYEVLPVRSSVEVLVTLPGGFEFKVNGWVRYVRDPFDFSADSDPGMGIQFENLTAHDRELIMRFIRKRAPTFYDD